MVAQARETAGNGGKAPVKVSDIDVAVHEFAALCEARFESYAGKVLTRSRVGKLKPGDRLWGQFRKAWLAWQSVRDEVTAAEYLEAQYYWFDRWFRRAPRTYQIGSAKAVQRVKMWLEERARGGARGRATPVVRRAKPVSQGEVDRHERRMLAGMVERWERSEREILLAFGGPDARVFNQRFLESLPAWRELRDKGAWT